MAQDRGLGEGVMKPERKKEGRQADNGHSMSEALSMDTAGLMGSDTGKKLSFKEGSHTAKGSKINLREGCHGGGKEFPKT